MTEEISKDEGKERVAAYLESDEEESDDVVVEVKDDGYVKFREDEKVEKTPEELAAEEAAAKESEDKDDPDKEDEQEEIDDPRPGHILAKELKTKYPEIMKEFPELRGTIFKAQEYVNLFGSISEAKEIKDQSDKFGEFQTHCLNGEPAPLLASLADADKKSYEKFMLNVLPTASMGDPDMFAKMTDPIIRNIINSVYSDGIKLGDSKEGKYLKNAALLFAKQLYGELKIPQASPLRREEVKADPERAKLDQERKEFTDQQFTVARTEVKSQIDAEVLRTIELGMKDAKLPPFTRTAIIRAIQEELSEKLENDKDHLSTMGRLWTEGSKSHFVGDIRNRVKKAYLGRVKPMILPLVRARLSEAGSTLPQPQIPSSTRKALPTGAPASGKSRLPDAKHIDWNKTDPMKLLDGEYVPRKG